ncbi:2-C-methyl-D-erythritol 4-phosphate cytidylyltransferase [Paenibacillus sediminis]|uniref:2-C-methyl-D-erythritol 4-phosphate cytidylyltransferase n=1 Tax=Paenibacillus sediminis TaxID=664909 RepID=A0ABS4H7A1_9BACL|nr:2-C-methyl-D-erythritol 4-phosphate cytidylyltransferase [Paenibacillus sediminis]MBP1938404.1 2-C-methyl-D-erythritol 4-phosphate cytidylyltransferase [Paenibacillus sediminis]
MNSGVGVVVVAAGKGSRMGTKESKQYLQLQGKPIIIHTLEVFDKIDVVDEIVLVTGAQDFERCQTWVNSYGLRKVTKIVAGGSERQHSVYKGLQEIRSSWVLVHDGVRPFVTEEQVVACYETARQHGASVLAVPVKDTIKQVNEAGVITATPDRHSLWAIQTPQAFRLSDLMRAHQEAQREGFVGTDDSMLVERLGMTVAVCEGSYSNIKITTIEDLDYAEFLEKLKGEKR